jgi:hypothetical protein
MRISFERLLIFIFIVFLLGIGVIGILTWQGLRHFKGHRRRTGLPGYRRQQFFRAIQQCQ